jgi:cardiolipin synthase
MFCQLIQAAKKRVWIASPYFVPDAPILTQLKLAALRGVDVRILLPAAADHYLTHLASFAFIEAVESFGVKFYRMMSAFSHQKVVLVDDIGASVGTANLDNRSLYLNFEITLLFVGSAFALEVASMLEADLKKSQLVPEGLLTTKPLPFRLAVRLARLFAPIL